MTGIYKITNKQNGKIYIGQATDIEQRFQEHKQKRYIPIDMWINMLGVENFNFEIVEECSLNELDKKEQEYIKQYNSIESGYNKQVGGFNNSIGSGNGRAKLNEEDVINIRKAYNNHSSYKETYQIYKDKISENQFQAVWQGRSWTHIMPEVFTSENKAFYTSEQNKLKAALTKNETFQYRKYYVEHTLKETYKKFLQEKGDILKESSFRKILCGDVRDNSIYKEVPIYNKKTKTWKLNNEPVSTIPETWE